MYSMIYVHICKYVEHYGRNTANRSYQSLPLGIILNEFHVSSILITHLPKIHLNVLSSLFLKSSKPALS
jgi:hypothetical protein